MADRTPDRLDGTHPHGWRRYLYATNHKDIGTMYLWFAVFAGIAGGILSLYLRAELAEPGLQVFKEPHTFNVFVTGHGVIMVFFMLMPGMIGGFGNWLVPLMIGAPEMAFPRLNNISFWLLPFAFVLLLLSFFVEGDPGSMGVSGGWTFYAPLSTTGSPGPAVDLAIFALATAGLSAILAAVNFITTIFNMRAPGMTLHKMPLFAWSMLVAGFMLLLSLPVLAGVFTMVLTDRHFGTSFFNAGGGGDPVLYQHLFWFFAHPMLTALILPGFGMISHVLAAFSRRPVFGYLGMVYAMVAMGFIGFMAWASHMYTTGLSAGTGGYFALATLAMAVPMTVLVFSWIATLWGGSLSFPAPMLFAIAFVLLVTIGGLGGLWLASPGLNVTLHDTMFVVAHLHYMLGLGALFAMFAGFYYWFPKFTGYLYNQTLAKIHFLTAFAGMNLTFFPMHFLGRTGMVRRVADYPDGFAAWNSIASLGAFIAGVGVLVFLAVVLEAVLRKRKAGDNPWGTGADTLEWTLPSPPPFHAYNVLPKIN